MNENRVVATHEKKEFKDLNPGDVCSYDCSAGSLRHVVHHTTWNPDLKKWYNLSGRTTAKDNNVDTKNGICYREAEPNKKMRHFVFLQTGMAFNADARDAS